MAYSPAFQLYYKDFRQDPKTICMTTVEIGAYWLLILECWDQDNSLPNDMDELSVMARMTLKQFEKLWEKKLRRCFRFDGRKDIYWHKRLDEEIQKQKRWSQAQSERGRKGAEALHNKGNNLDGGGIASPESSMATPSSSSSSSSSSSFEIEEEEKNGAKPPVEIIPVERRIWKDGVDLLTHNGTNEAQARSLLGKMVKDYKKELVAECIAVTQAENAADPKAFLMKVLKKRSVKLPQLVVGRNDEPEPEPQCKACHDSGQISQLKADSTWQFEFVPCPDCKSQEAAA